MSSAGVDEGDGLRPVVGTAIVIAVGVLLASVPIYDMWTDVLDGKPLLSTVFENLPLVGLSAAIVIGGVHLYRTQLEPKYLRTIVAWMLSSAAFVSVLFLFIIAIQQYLQNELRPRIIAADAIVVAALGGLLIGIRTAERKQVEDDRFDALFDNVPNPIVEVEVEGESAITKRVNSAFTEVFGFDRSEVVGEPLAEYIVPARGNIDPIDENADRESEIPTEVLEREAIELETLHGRREFVRLTVPGKREGAESYAIYIDVTSQKQRQERLRVLARILRHDIRNHVSVILGYTQYLSGRLEDDDAEKLDSIAEAASDLVNISERTRIAEELAVESSDQRPIRLRPTVEAVLDNLCDTDDAEIDAAIPADACVQGTADLGTAIAEIVENAIVHNDASTPEVSVTAERTYDGEYYELRIADDGSGIDPSLYEVVIGDRERSQLDHSSGLGIWLAYWVCRASGGELDFEADDSGTTVILRVPAIDPTDDAVVAHPDSSRRPEE
jgi:PAS domain S-box-containing protein